MSYQDVMNTILPPQQGRSPHITGHYGEHRGNGPHGGSDFNYVGGQAGVNLTHPTLHSPVTGTVEFVGGRYGTVTIVDGEGNRHQLLHTQSQSVVVGQRVEPGTPIGTIFLLGALPLLASGVACFMLNRTMTPEAAKEMSLRSALSRH